MPPRNKLAPDKLPDYLRSLHKLGVTSINAEASNNWGPRGLTYYLAAQLMWDVNADAKALLRDFYERAFGPAATAMERYYVIWHGGGAAAGNGEAADETGDGKEEALDTTKLARMMKALDEATRLAKDRPECLARIDHLRMYVHYLVLRQRTQQTVRSKDEKAKIDAVREETLFGAKLTYTNVIHSRPLLGKAFGRRFKAFEKVLANVPEAQRDNQGWRRIGQPPTRAELDQLWMADRAALKVE